MEYKRLGKSGLQVSVVGLGCNNFGMRIDKDQTKAVVDKAIDAGVTLFDTANLYGGTRSEEFLGAALGEPPQGRRAGHQVRRADGRQRAYAKGGVAAACHAGCARTASGA